MRLCRKGEPLYKVLHLKLIEDISLRGETVRYSSVAENTLNEFLALISEKLQVSMKYFDPQYDIQLNNFNGTMKTLDDSIKLNKNFEERWSKELSTPLDRAEEIVLKRN
ncbi:unnamed protein product [Lepeophtheirus salmonis]|uniref:(salmon louse) hypothetical protein n=1 Tax=Lepeophtheirus salmonis TaxID=72036 RepID=A0A7R8H8H6_LEPSM|nr:unnamed protein product [Lepeophtheirus salmonis]CAF2942250.1 unnamed protein product [Lepeophtheirus salmonis]